MAVSTAEMVQAVGAVASDVAARADEIEAGRRLPDEVVTAIRDTGINRMAIPAALGGMEAPVAAMMDAVERLSAADGSTGWCTAIGAGSNLLAGYLPEAAAREVFADPDQGNATMFQPCGALEGDDGRLSLSGRWPFASNVLHSAWIGLGALVRDPAGDGPPAARICWVPVDDVTVEDTWDALGLRGTGSHHVAVAGLPFDPQRSCTFADTPWPEGTLWRVPIYCALLPVLVAVPLGIARGAVDEVARQAREGRTNRRGQVGDDPLALATLADVDTRLRAAGAGLRAVVREIHDRAERGEPVDRPLQARNYLACLLASDVAVEVTAAAHALGGGAAAYAASPLPRALRDVQTGRQHLLLSPRHRIELGRIITGTDATYPPFVT